MKIAKKTAAAVTALVVTASAAAPFLPDLTSYVSYQVSAADAAPAYSLTVGKELVNIKSLKTLKSYKDDDLLEAVIVNDDVESGKYDDRLVAEVKFSIDENPGLWGAQFYFSYDKDIVFAGCKKYTDGSKHVSNFETIPDDNLTVNADTSKLVVLFNKDGVNITETGEFATLLFVLPEKPELDHEYEISFLDKTKKLVTPWSDEIKPGCNFNPGYIKLTDKAVESPVTTAVTSLVPPVNTGSAVTTTEMNPVVTSIIPSDYEAPGTTGLPVKPPTANPTASVTTTAKVTETSVTTTTVTSPAKTEVSVTSASSVTTTGTPVPAAPVTTTTVQAVETPAPSATPVPAEKKIQIKLSDTKAMTGKEAVISVEALNIGTGFSAVQFNYEMDTRLKMADGLSDFGKWTLGTTEKAVQFLEKNGNNIKTDGVFGELYIEIPYGLPAGKYPVKISGFKGSVFDETVRKQRALTDDNFVSEVAYITVEESPEFTIPPPENNYLSPSGQNEIIFSAPDTLSGDADIKIDVPVQKMAYTEDKKQIEMKVNLSDYDPSRADFNFAGFAFDLPEGYSIAGIKSSVVSYADIYRSEKDYSEKEKFYFETLVNSAKFGSNCQCVKLESVDTSKLSGNDELFTLIINVPDKADFANNIGVAAAFGKSSADPSTNTVVVTPIITKAGPYAKCDAKIYSGLRGDVNLDHVVNLLDATTIKRELLSQQTKGTSILANLVKVQNPDDDMIELSRLLGDVDGSDGGKFNLIDSARIKRALLVKETSLAGSVTEDIWNTVLNKK